MEDRTSTTTEDTFDRLLAAMSSIAEAVNKFDSDKNQRAALDALIRAIGVPVGTVPSALPLDGGEAVLHAVPSLSTEQAGRPATMEEIASQESAENGTEKAPRRRKSKSGGKKTYQVPKNLNFAPEGHPSLEEFIAEKQPRTNDERHLVACYYLSEMMGIEEVGVEEILAVYLAADWAPPAHPASSLRGAAHRTGWIDTANTDSITVVWKGETYIKSKMPNDKKTAV